jgi:hypothetical protein
MCIDNRAIGLAGLAIDVRSEQRFQIAAVSHEFVYLWPGLV